MTQKICVSILPKTLNEAHTLIKKAEQNQADLIEIRLDSLEQTINLSELTRSTKTPLIATNKPQTEKDDPATINKWQQTLIEAAKAGFQYVDVDFFSPKRDETVVKLKQLGTQPIISYHKFDGVLSVFALEKILNEQLLAGAAVCKIVLTANQIEDNLPILSFISFASTKAKLVCFCMGKAGKASRLLSPAFGAYFTFASLEHGDETAPGQMTITDMRIAYEVLGIEP